MKIIAVLFFSISILLLSCSKNNSATAATGSTDSVPVATSTKLIKTEIATFNSGDLNIDSFAYDSQNRALYYSQNIVNKTTPSLNYLFEYHFTYQGTDKYPVNFTSIQTEDPLHPLPADVSSFRDTLIYNSNHQLITDSTVYNSVNIAYAVNTVRHYSYSDKMVIRTLTRTNSNGSNYLDSIFLDNNGNQIKTISGSLNNNTYTLTGVSTSVFATSVYPFSSGNTDVIINCIDGIIPYKNWENSRVSTSYSSNGTATATTYTFQYLTDSKGLLQQMNYAVTGPYKFSVSTAYNYY